jgi:hypothetical protein
MDNSNRSINNFKASDELKEVISSLPPGIVENIQNLAPGRPVDKPKKISKKLDPPSLSNQPKGPVATSTKQSMSYVTVANIESETSYQKADWPIFVLKELQDNAYDWFNAFYPARIIADRDKRKIGVRIWITKESENLKFVHIAVRNSNVDKYPVFGDLKEIFDFTIWHSTKRYQHGMTCGSLGDFLKRGLGMGYALFYESNNPEFEKVNESTLDAQWMEPTILRFNGYEYKAFIKVDRPVQKIWSEIERQQNPSSDVGNDTEIVVALPMPPIISNYFSGGSWVDRLKQYYRDYKIGKSRTEFRLDFKGEGIVDAR